MSTAGAHSGADPNGLPATTTQPPQCTTRIPDCAGTPLDALADTDPGTLSRLLPSTGPWGPSFNSSI
ncbi:hypothetical protein [Streptomyces sp. NPDC046197]|uniref:hypothetical protein n=1 Tax=Streptomyces sp. NPDC046197 TaxID=3154337 RepID=UPI00340E9363